jgi:hypothetical protein
MSRRLNVVGTRSSSWNTAFGESRAESSAASASIASVGVGSATLSPPPTDTKALDTPVSWARNVDPDVTDPFVETTPDAVTIKFVDYTNEALIRKNQAAKEKIPAFNGKDFVIGRAPVAFTFVNKQKHSSVGYVDKDLLDKMGFKSDNLGGYTLLHNQMVVGIDAHAVYNKLTDDSGKESMVRQRVKDSVITFKAGKPTRVVKARDKLHLDVAKKVKKLIEQKTNTRYEFVSEVAVGLNNGEFFWLMPVADLNRLARAFPGGHAKINKWGFAF